MGCGLGYRKPGEGVWMLHPIPEAWDGNNLVAPPMGGPGTCYCTEGKVRPSLPRRDLVAACPLAPGKAAPGTGAELQLLFCFGSS